MQKKYHFHPALFLVQDTTFTLAYITVFTFWLIPVLLKGELQYYRMNFVHIALTVSFVVFVGLYILKRLFFRIKNTCYIITENAIIKRSTKKQTTINFSSITNLMFKRNFLRMRYFSVKSKEKEIKIPLIVNHCNKIIHFITENLNNTDTNQIYSESNIENGINYAFVDEYNLNQSTHFLTPIIFWASLFMIFGFASGLYLWNVHVVIAAMWSVISIIFPLIAFVITYMIEMRKKLSCLENSQYLDISEPDMKPYIIGLFYALICYFFMGVIFKNTWSLILL